MRQIPQDHPELAEILTKGRQHLRRARIAAIVAVMVIVGHFEYILLSYAEPVGGLKALLLLGYPVLLGTLAVSSLWAGRDSTRPGSKR